MRLRVFLIAVLLVVGAGAIVVSLGGLPSTASDASATYLTSAATVGTVSDDIAATGTVALTDTWGLAFGTEPHRTAAASAAATSSGGAFRVATVEVVVGQAVKAGDVLATADASSFDADIAAALNSWRIARIQETTAEEGLADAEDDGTSALIRQARISYYSAQNQVAQARATYVDLVALAGRSRLVAPVDGIVTAVAIEPGLDAPSGDAITLSAAWELTASVVEDDVSALIVGQVAQVQVGALGADVAGTVTAIAPLAGTTGGGTSGGVVTFPVTIRLDAVPAGLRSGMTADVTITTASATDVLTIPTAALRGSAGAYRVLVLAADGTTTSRDVEVGLVTGSLVEIRSGLTAGELVVTGTSSTRQTTTQGGGTGPGAIPGGGIIRGGG